MDLGPHATFILASYAAVTLVLGALIGWLWHDGRTQQRMLEDLEARGVRRGRGGRRAQRQSDS